MLNSATWHNKTTEILRGIFFYRKIKVKDCPLVKPYKDGRLFFCINIAQFVIHKWFSYIYYFEKYSSHVKVKPFRYILHEVGRRYFYLPMWSGVTPKKDGDLTEVFQGTSKAYTMAKLMHWGSVVNVGHIA